MPDTRPARIYAARERLVPASNKDLAADLNPQQAAAFYRVSLSSILDMAWVPW